MAYKRPKPTSRKVIALWCIGSALVLILMVFGILQTIKAPQPIVPSKKAEDKKEVVETPKVEPKALPKVETPKVEPKALPKVETPKAEPKVTPKVDPPKVEPKALPKVEPKAETPKVEPKVEAPKREEKVSTLARAKDYTEVYQKRVTDNQLTIGGGKVILTPSITLIKARRYGDGRLMLLLANADDRQDLQFQGVKVIGAFQPFEVKSRNFAVNGNSKENLVRPGIVQLIFDVDTE